MTSKHPAIPLSSEQQAAVEFIGPALVVAGAGSGKTRTLTAKIAHLITIGYRPEEILAITFTNKAAGEMKNRLTLMTGLSPERFPWVRTFHSACFQILKEHCPVLGYAKPLQIYSDYQQQKTLKEILLKCNIDKKNLHTIGYHISQAKNSGNPGRYFDAQRRMTYGNLRDIYDLYEKDLFSKNAVDFDNILLKTRDLLQREPDITAACRRRFRYVLVDEYQDTNNLQEDITGLLLGHRNLFCVGDDWQAIYGFRGSNVDHFLAFARKYEGAKIFRLEQNYRSSDEIVKAANGLIKYNPDRVDKSCFSKKSGGVVEVHDFFSDDEEAEWVAKKIKKLAISGAPTGRMAVLYRTRFCSLSFEKAFRKANIPYKMLGSKGFFERMEILDLTCYLMAAAFPKDDAAFERILNTPKRGIGPVMVQKINALRTEGMSLQDAARKAVSEKALPDKVYKAMKELLELLDHIRDLPPDAAIRIVLDKTAYLEYMKSVSKTSEDQTARVENIEQLTYSASQHDTLMDYLEEATLVREDKEDNDAPEAAVSLSTMHASKGLEFHTVFVAGCEENLLPHYRARESEKDLQEERRLMYVAMTRAGHQLYITSANYRKGQFNPVSRFVAEVKG